MIHYRLQGNPTDTEIIEGWHSTNYTSHAMLKLSPHIETREPSFAMGTQHACVLPGRIHHIYALVSKKRGGRGVLLSQISNVTSVS